MLGKNLTDEIHIKLSNPYLCYLKTHIRERAGFRCSKITITVHYELRNIRRRFLQ